MGYLQRVILTYTLAALFLHSAASAKQYDGQGPGESTIGTGGDYPSLFAACDAISSQPLTGGDWTFLILNDLVEPNNVSVTQEVFNGHTISFRPAPFTMPTVTFTTTTANGSGLVGHFNIGARVDRRNPDGSYIAVPTQHVVIDGSNDPTTSARSMTWKNTGMHAGSSPLIVVYGDSNNVTIRNCSIDFRTPNFNELYNRAAVEFCSFTFSTESGKLDLVPDFGRVENCQFELEEAYGFGYAISLNNRTVGEKNFAYPPAMGMVAANNDIISGAEAIVVRNCGDPLISGNNILINARLRSSRDTIHCTGAATPGDSGRVVMDSNTIVCTGTQLSHWHAAVVRVKSTTTTVLFSNNMISSLSDGAFTKIAGLVAVVDDSSTVTIAHNSINFDTDVPNATLGQYRAVDLSDGNTNDALPYTGNIDVRNNIFRMNSDNGVVFAMPEGYGNFFQSNNNVLYTTSTAHIAWVGQDNLPLSSLTDWQTSSGQDMASVIQDPFVPAAPGLGTWMGQADDPKQDLHFSSFPGEVYLVPSIPGVQKDFDMEQRSSDSTVAGADEVQRLTSVENWQLF